MKTIKRMNKKTIAVFLSVLMLLSLFPVSVFAEGDADAVISELRPVENSDIKIIGDYVRAVPEMSVDKIKNQLSNENVNVVDKDGKALADDAVVGTGSKIQVLDNNGKVLSEYEVLIPGDANGDGYITASDARIALRTSAKLDLISELQRLAVDIDENGKNTAADARMLLRISSEIDNYLDFHIHKYTEKIITEPSCTKEGTAEYCCAECGDKYTAATPVRHTDSNGDGVCDICNEECFATCTVTDNIDHSGNEFKVYVAFKKGMSIRSADLVLNYNPAELEYVDCLRQFHEDIKIYAYGNPAPGKATVSFAFIDESITQSFDLCVMTFKALTNKPTNISLSIKSLDDKMGGKSDVLIPVPIGEEHDYTSIDIVEPTCTEEGLRAYTCTICGDSYTEIIPETGHIDDNNDKICDVCGDTTEAAVVLFKMQFNDRLVVAVDLANAEGVNVADLQINYAPEYLEYIDCVKTDPHGDYIAVGDNPEKGKCIISTIWFSTIEHNYTEICLLEFNILKYGNTTVAPDIIHWDGEKAPAISALNISLEENLCEHIASDVDIIEPTCIKDGVMKYTCLVCNGSFEDILPATGHIDKDGDTRCDNCGLKLEFGADELQPVENSDIKVIDTYAQAVPGMSVDTIKGQLLNEKVKVLDKDGKELSADKLVGTGSKIQVLGTDGNVLAEYEVVIPMDVNGDAKVTAADARLALRKSAKLEKLEGAFEQACEADGIMGITAADARRILRVSAKLEDYWM